MGMSKPTVHSVASSPQYTKAPQANPLYQLEIMVHGKLQWHGRSDVETLWGSVEKRIQSYWVKSGQKPPIEPLPEYERIRLQERAMLAEKKQADANRRRKVLRLEEEEEL